MPRFILTFVGKDDKFAIKQLLKIAWRRFQLKCVEIEQRDDDDPRPSR
jgi:hypothetical protein